MAQTNAGPQQRASNLEVALTTRQEDFSKLLPIFVSKERDRFFQLALTASMNPGIAACDQVSIVDSVLKSAQWGLQCDGVQAALVPYKGKCTFIPMYKGLLAVARRSGEIKQFWTDIVLEGDPFKQVRGGAPTLTHEWGPSSRVESKETYEKLRAVYACARWADGFVDFEVMDRDEIDRICQKSVAKNGPWSTDYLAMARKTVLRRLCKNLPLEAKVLELLQSDEYEEIEVSEEERLAAAREVKAEAGPNRAAQAEAILNAKPTAADTLIPAERWVAEVRIWQQTGEFEAWKAEKIGSKAFPVLTDLTWEEAAKSANAAVRDALLKVVDVGANTQREKGPEFAVAIPFQRAALVVEWRSRHPNGEAAGAEVDETAF